MDVGECSFKFLSDRAHKEEYGITRDSLTKRLTVRNPSLNAPLFDVMTLQWDRTRDARADSSNRADFAKSCTVFYIKTAEAYVRFLSWRTYLAEVPNGMPYISHICVRNGSIYCLASENVLRIMRDFGSHQWPDAGRFVEDKVSGLGQFSVELLGSSSRNLPTPLNDEQIRILKDLACFDILPTHVRNAKPPKHFTTERTLCAIQIAMESEKDGFVNVAIGTSSRETL